ncbi:hypothetical protein BGZ46_007027 [Entomortierella lignicola]|nr:hypothetical protein BGZ46_007027 [Entomortierella lignicola]
MVQYFQQLHYKAPRLRVLLIVLGLVSIKLVTGYTGAHPTNLDVHMREMLCSNQLAMCHASCQSNIQRNSCDSETLEWSCVCATGTSKVFNDWQFPIPFKLCSRSLLSCLKSCPRIEDFDKNQEPGVAHPKVDAQAESNQQRQQSWTPPSTESPVNIDDDYDEDDYDAIEEAQQTPLSLKLTGDSYSRYDKEGIARMITSEKMKHLHRQLWTIQRNEIISEDRRFENNVGDKGSMETTAFIAFSDPVHRDPTCVSRCQAEYACGTESAPEFHGVSQISQSGDRASLA